MTNKDLKDGILPCPFCGGEAHSGISWVECKECPASMEGPDKEDYLTTSWNTRSTPAIADGVGVEGPAVFYCENGRNLDGLEQAALAVLSNLMIKTNATSAKFMIGNDKDGQFRFQCLRTPPQAATDEG